MPAMHLGIYNTQVCLADLTLLTMRVSRIDIDPISPGALTGFESCASQKIEKLNQNLDLLLLRTY